MADVVTFGEPMVLLAGDRDKIYDSNHFTKYIAGSELNVSVGLARLGHDVIYATKLGEDPFGRYIYDFIKKEGINPSYIKFDSSNLTGLMFKSKKENGDPEIFYFRKHSAASFMDQKDLEFVKLLNPKFIHLTGITLGLSTNTRNAFNFLLKIAKGKNVPVIFDPNLRPQLWKDKDEMAKIINDAAFSSDIFLPGLKEAEILTGLLDPKMIGHFYIEKGVKIVIIKMGEKGAFVISKDESYDVPAFHVKVVDTVGAGDGFDVGIISGLLDGISLREAIVRANAIGAMQVMTPGDNDGLPNRAKLEEFLRGAR
ncbi:sugar kinase [Athalassotoga saccharophila]|uniref:sugar kinase n=1 Tax=Athalassotoga saccharophila TaxID=1441386 RepID=UPI00137B08BF|nr:sugar kinase [Athalassotoga saccharophila]BBJ27287.1 2-dehydro-3-deoxygluconokinase [Athalassotoga saccharophila]